jgi:transposase
MKKPNSKEVGLIIAQLVKLGMSHEQIAGELKVSFTSVYNWAREKRSPSWVTYDALLVLLHKAKKKGKK